MADNQHVNKVEYAGQTLMDLTGDTVTPSSVLNGETFHDRSGTPQQGSLITHNVYDGLDSTSTDDALSANQGRILNQAVEKIGIVPSGQTVEGQISMLNVRSVKYARLWNASNTITLPSVSLCSYLFIATGQGANGQITSNTQATVAILNFNSNEVMNILIVAGKTPNITKNGNTITVANDYGYGWCGLIPISFWE